MFKLQPLADTRIPKHRDEYQVITTIVAPLLGGIQSDIVTVFSLQTSNSVGIGCLQSRVQLRLWGFNTTSFAWVSATLHNIYAVDYLDSGYYPNSSMTDLLQEHLLYNDGLEGNKAQTLCNDVFDS
jgi:hypothetical protein